MPFFLIFSPHPLGKTENFGFFRKDNFIKFHRRHHFQRGNSQLFKIGNLFNYSFKGSPLFRTQTRRSMLCKTSGMDLVNDAVLSRNSRKTVIFPVKIRTFFRKYCMDPACSPFFMAPASAACKLPSKRICCLLSILLKGVFQTLKLSLYGHKVYISHPSLMGEGDSGDRLPAPFFEEKQPAAFCLRNKTHIKAIPIRRHTRRIDPAFVCHRNIILFHLYTAFH